MLVVAMLFGAIGLFSLIRPRKALVAATFFAPWESLQFDAGVQMSVYRMFLASLIVSALARRRLSDVFKVPVPPAFVLLWLYAVAITLLMIPYHPQSFSVSSAFRNPAFRGFTQIVMFFLKTSPLLLVPLLISSHQETKVLAKTYILSAATLAGLGYLQYIVWQASGTDIFPINIAEGIAGEHGGYSDPRTGMLRDESITSIRINALAGEPKSLGQTLGVAMLLIQTLLSTGVSSSKKRLVALWFFLSVAMLLTWSTSAFYLWTLGSLVLPASTLIPGFSSRRLSGALSATLGVGLLLMATAVFISMTELTDFSLVDMLEQRTLERGFSEDFDIAIGRFLADQPTRGVFGVGLGAAHLYAMPYLPFEALRYALGQVFAAKSTYLRFISETGIIGLGFLSVALVTQVRRMSQLARETKGETQSVATKAGVFLLVLLPCYLARGYVEDHFYIAFGTMIAMYQRTALQSSSTHSSPTSSMVHRRNMSSS